jgi:predicted 3-demethylubiquinone-9 3-methyltransferase (glyoxalase superfamily)
MKVCPFLMFQGNAETAMNFYVSLFPDAEIVDAVRYGPGEGGAGSSSCRDDAIGRRGFMRPTGRSIAGAAA